MENNLEIHVATDFSKTLGARYKFTLMGYLDIPRRSYPVRSENYQLTMAQTKF
jgi:hypothetical protein